MARPKAFTDLHYMKALPREESEAITSSDVAIKVGCSRAAANRWLRSQLESDLVRLGPPSNMGALTYYLTSSRPDNWMPRMADNNGVLRPFNLVVAGVLKLDTKALSRTISKPTILGVMRLWIDANSDDDIKFTETNQKVRVELQAARTKLKEALYTLDSVLNDPFLSDTNEVVEMAQGAMRAESSGISLEEVIDKYNDLRQA